MGFDFFRNLKSKVNGGKPNIEDDSSNEGVRDFYLGVEDTFSLIDSDDIVAVGRVYGTIKANDVIYITNLGDDDASMSLSTALALEFNAKTVESATDQPVAVKIELGSKLNLKPGSVIHTRVTTTANVHNAYINALGYSYISLKKMKLEPTDYEKMNLMDLAELRRLYREHLQRNSEKRSETEDEENKKIFDALGKQMASRILCSNEIYAVMHKQTGEPYMHSLVFNDGQGNYIVSPPDIILLPKANINIWKQMFNQDIYDVVKIENGDDGKGIYNFLGTAFYLNGACGVKVIYSDFSIGAECLVKKPDYSNVPEIQIPVTNPDLERWLLLLGQMGELKTDDEKLIYNIFSGHMFRELAKAKLLIPMKIDAQMDPADENGKTTIKEGGTISFRSGKGKYDRDAVLMYTDWKRFRMENKEDDGWEGWIQPISGMIEKFDCMVNLTDFINAGCYVGQNMYDECIKKYVEE